MKPTAPQLLAGDPNVGMDLADGNEWVLDAMATIRRRLPGCSLLVPPTVAEELAWLAVQAEEPEERESARSFPRQHRTWGFALAHAVPLGGAYVDQVARRLSWASPAASAIAQQACKSHRRTTSARIHEGSHEGKGWPQKGAKIVRPADEDHPRAYRRLEGQLGRGFFATLCGKKVLSSPWLLRVFRLCGSTG